MEGAPTAGNRSLSVWDVFASKPGNIQDGSNPSVATDFYHKYKEDIALMKAMGVKNFRSVLQGSAKPCESVQDPGGIMCPDAAVALHDECFSSNKHVQSSLCTSYTVLLEPNARLVTS